MVLLTLLLIPTLVALGTFILGKHLVTWKEFLAQLVAQTAIVGVAMWAIYHMDTWDTEIWGGRVASKAREIVSCSHSYTCNCVTVSCGKDCSTTVCQTCYEHSYDVDWAVYTTNKERLEIDRVNRQGTTMPARWQSVLIGEPTAVAHSYTNYIKASPDSLFRHQGLVEKYQTKLASYPGEIYDYYRINRLRTVGLSVPDEREWNKDLQELNADLGRVKEAFVSVVLVKDQPEDYFDALEQKWIGGKKNDIVVVLGTDGQAIYWARVMAWTDSQMFKIQARDQLLEAHILDRKVVLGIIDNTVREFFLRKSMKDFEYLTQSIAPTTGQFVFLFIFGLAVSLGLSYYVFNNNETEGYSASHGYRNFGRFRRF